MHDYSYQPAWVDFSIFWGVIVAGLGLAVIIQMEFGGYEALYWPAVVGFLAVAAVAGWQIWRYRLHLDAEALVLRRGWRSNQLRLPLASINGIEANKHSLILNTRSYGKISLVRLGRMQPLLAALSNAGLTVTQKGEKHV